jgi:hypothetical protein
MSEITADQAADAQQQAGMPNQPAGGVDEKSKQPTKYVVLFLASKTQSGADAWVEGGIYEARSPAKAIDRYMDTSKEEEGTFIAVPARSWERVAVKTETRTRRIFE